MTSILQERERPDDAPWWATFAFRIGIPMSAAIVLVGVIIRLLMVSNATIEANLSTVERGMQMMQEGLSQHQAQMAQEMNMAQESRKTTERLLVIICINSATTDSRRQACVRQY